MLILLILVSIGCFYAYVFKDGLVEFLRGDSPLSFLVLVLAGAVIGGLVAAGVITFFESPEAFVEKLVAFTVILVMSAAPFGLSVLLNGGSSSPPRRGGSEGTGSDHRSSDDGGWFGDGGDGGDGGG